MAVAPAAGAAGAAGARAAQQPQPQAQAQQQLTTLSQAQYFQYLQMLKNSGQLANNPLALQQLAAWQQLQAQAQVQQAQLQRAAGQAGAKVDQAALTPQQQQQLLLQQQQLLRAQQQQQQPAFPGEPPGAAGPCCRPRAALRCPASGPCPPCCRPLDKASPLCPRPAAAAIRPQGIPGGGASVQIVQRPGMQQVPGAVVRPAGLAGQQNIQYASAMANYTASARRRRVPPARC